MFHLFDGLMCLAIVVCYAVRVRALFAVATLHRLWFNLLVNLISFDKQQKRKMARQRWNAFEINQKEQGNAEKHNGWHRTKEQK